MNTNYVNYQVALVPENAELIQKLNRMLINGEAPADDKPATKAEKPAPKAKPEPKAEAPAESTMDIKEFKGAVSAAKKEHGEDFVNFVIKSFGCEISDKLLNTVKAVSEDKYEQIADALGSNEYYDKFEESKTDDLDDDDLNDDDLDDTPAHLDEIDVSAVETAVRAAVKAGKRSEMKTLLEENGAGGKISGLADCNQKQLAAILKAAS